MLARRARGAAIDPATSLEERRAATRWVDQTVDTDTDTGTPVTGSCIQSSNAFNRTSWTVTRVRCGAAMSAGLGLPGEMAVREV